MCKDRPKSECQGEWEPGCDLGANEKFVRKAEQPEPGVLTDAMSPEQVARMFHECYERLAPNFGYETRKETRSFDAHSANGKLMIAVCGLVSSAIAREVLATTRKRTAEQNARIMGLVGRLVSAMVNAACLQEREPSVENQNKYWVARRALTAEVERLLGGEA